MRNHLTLQYLLQRSWRLTPIQTRCRQTIDKIGRILFDSTPSFPYARSDYHYMTHKYCVFIRMTLRKKCVYIGYTADHHDRQASQGCSCLPSPIARSTLPSDPSRSARCSSLSSDGSIASGTCISRCPTERIDEPQQSRLAPSRRRPVRCQRACGSRQHPGTCLGRAAGLARRLSRGHRHA